MVSFSDLIDGPKMFRETFGPKWGPRWWWLFFAIIILAAGAFGLSEIGAVGKSAYSEVWGWFSPKTAPPGIGSGRQAPSTGNCEISGGTNNGVQIQNCP
jgi:hypothetical protein